MPIVKELLKSEQDGSLSFGNYELSEKTKLSDFEHAGDLYKVKTFNEITKLERNGLFVYESVPGTTVLGFKDTDKGVEFSVEGAGDAQITLGLLENTEYSVFVNGSSIGKMSTNLGGKLNLSVELSANGKATVRVEK
ncbi:MAG TPA: endosialidase [Eubacterium sp.]|nr:endosialidase [Eubacterium sp.]